MIPEITEAVKNKLNAAPPGTFSQAFEAKRFYRMDNKLEDFATLRVSVQPGPTQRSQIARNAMEKFYAVGVIVQKYVAAETVAEIDPLVLLCEQIADFVGPGEIVAGAYWIGTEHDPVYDLDHMRDLKLFTNSVVFSFRA